MKGERRWTQGGSGKYARLAGAPAGRNYLGDPVLGSSLDFRQEAKQRDRTVKVHPSRLSLLLACRPTRTSRMANAQTTRFSVEIPGNPGPAKDKLKQLAISPCMVVGPDSPWGTMLSDHLGKTP